MSTLLLRLAGPMQAWGTQSRFEARDTEREPSKSGVIGLLCAALGRHRSAPLDDLVALRMAVRVDREGSVAVDYHTAGTDGIVKSSGEVRNFAVLSRRYYLADADFLVGLEGDRDLLAVLDEALRYPCWQLCLGRKSMLPGESVRLPDREPFGPGLRDGSLEETIAAFPVFLRDDGQRGENRGTTNRRIVIDDDAGIELRRDVPVSFEQRIFRTRNVRTYWDTPPPPKFDSPKKGDS